MTKQIYPYSWVCMIVQTCPDTRMRLAHEQAQLNEHNLEVSDAFPNDLNTLAGRYISVSWHYTHEGSTSQRGWHQFEVGQIELSDTKEDVNTSREVNVKYVRDPGGLGYPVKLDKRTFVPGANHVPNKQYMWRLLKSLETAH